MADKYQMIFNGVQLKADQFNGILGSEEIDIDGWDGLFEGSSLYFPAHNGGIGQSSSNKRYIKSPSTAITKEGATWWLRIYYCDNIDCTKEVWIGNKTTGINPSGRYNSNSGELNFSYIDVKRFCDCQHNHIKIELKDFTGHGQDMNKTYILSHYPAFCYYDWTWDHPQNTGGMCTLYYVDGSWQFRVGNSRTFASANILGGCPSVDAPIIGEAKYIDYSDYPIKNTDSGTIHIGVIS